MRVYKKTLTISFFACFILAIISAILNIWNEFKWISFAVNWCVGIACSLVVVIITTHIQYKAEKHRISIELTTESLIWLNKLSELKRLLDKSNEHKEVAETEEWQETISDCVEEYIESTYKCLSLTCEYDSFSKESSKVKKNLNHVFGKIYKLFTDEKYDKRPLQLIQKLKFTINVMEILENLISFSKQNDLDYLYEKLSKKI